MMETNKFYHDPDTLVENFMMEFKTTLKGVEIRLMGVTLDVNEPGFSAWEVLVDGQVANPDQWDEAMTPGSEVYRTLCGQIQDIYRRQWEEAQHG